MPPKKKKRKQGITTVDTIAALDRVQLPCHFSRGAIEALRVCHAQFVSLVAAELALLCKDTDTVTTLQPTHVDACLEKLGLTHYKPHAIIQKPPPAAAAAAPARTKKRKKWSAELQAEQEKLLIQSKQTMQRQQQTHQQQP